MGGTLARASKEGHRVVVVVATNGDHGEIPADMPVGKTLVEVRHAETLKSAETLGVHRVVWLGYEDSGMTGWAQNTNAGAFCNAALDEAAQKLADVLREENADVLTTYDWHGGYGHPDHIQAHRVAMRASELSQWQIQKIYWNTIPKSVIAQGMEKMKEIGSDFFGAENIDDIPFAKDDEFVTTLIEGTAYVDQKMAAMKAHETQIALDGPFFALSNNLGMQIWGDEYYTLVKGTKSAPFDSNGREMDLTSGLIL